jgi:heat shock protein HtpX
MLTYFKRFFFLIATNIAIMVMLTGILILIENFFPGLTALGGGMMKILIIALVIGFGGAFFSLAISRYIAKKSYNITLIDEITVLHEWVKVQAVYSTVLWIAQSQGIVLPEVGIYESPEPNAFATGSSKNKALVAVSTGLLDAMDIYEIEGVVGHEMAHILNGDMVTLTLIQWVMNTFVFFLSRIVWQILDQMFFRSDDEELSGMSWFFVTIILEILFWLLAQLVVMYFSRIREYRADLWGAKYTSRAKMIAGLKKLQKMTDSSLSDHADPRMSAMMITWKDSFFSTHPSLVNRITRLEQNYQLP